jgi:uncharacterized iron-regulated membrane protein
MTPAFWRRWHRWIGLPAAVFLLFVSATGFLLAATEFFGEAEALREATRDLVSAYPAARPEPIAQAVTRALQAVQSAAPGSPVDKVDIQLKGATPTISVFTGKPTGGEDRRFVIDATTGVVLKTEGYEDKPFLHRLHSGEAFGDGGLVAAMLWAIALCALTISGTVILWRMRRKDVTGWRRYFF